MNQVRIVPETKPTVPSISPIRPNQTWKGRSALLNVDGVKSVLWAHTHHINGICTDQVWTWRRGWRLEWPGSHWVAWIQSNQQIQMAVARIHYMFRVGGVRKTQEARGIYEFLLGRPTWSYPKCEVRNMRNKRNMRMVFLSWVIRRSDGLTTFTWYEETSIDRLTHSIDWLDSIHYTL